MLIMAALSLFAGAQQRFTVHFATDQSALQPEALQLLDSLIAIYQQHPELTLELTGHCDFRGSDAYNEALSERRVKAVADYLTQKGVINTVIKKEEGYGERQPVDSGATDAALARNRRVEILMYVPAPVVVKAPEPPAPKTLTESLTDTALKAGSTVVLQNLHFVGGRHYILPQSYPVLKDLLAALQANPGLVISIEGHVCCLPDDRDGLDLDAGTENLSENRAKAVYDYLIKNGIGARRLSYQGFGHRFPLVPYPEQSEEQKTLNRRVEIRIISK